MTDLSPVSNLSDSLPKSPYHQGWAAALLILISLAAYLPVTQCNYIWDDDYYVTQNTTLHDWDGLVRIWAEPGAVPQYYPLVHTVFWIQYQLFELNPLSYHLVNVAFHILVSLLWWRLLLRLSIPGSWLAAAIFAIHPIQVESVVWITELKNVLSGMFYLLSAIAYLRFASPPPGSFLKTIPVPQDISGNTLEISTKTSRACWYGIALLCFVGALLSKTVVCTLPAALILVMWWKRDRFPWRDLVYLLPFFIIGIVMGLHTAAMEKHTVGALGQDWAFSIADRILIAGRVLWFYIGKIIWPEHLVFFYDYWAINVNQRWQWLFPVSFILLIYALLRNRRYISGQPLVALLFYAGSLFPALGFINVFPMRYSFVADHFQYLAGMGIIAWGAGVFWHVMQNHKTARNVLAACVLIALTCRTLNYIPVYQNQTTLWNHVIANNREPWMALNNRGIIYKELGHLDKAVICHKRAIVIRPHEWNNYSNLAIIYKQQGLYEQAGKLFKIALAIHPNSASNYSSLAQVRELQQDIPNAIKLFEKALKIDPNRADIWLNMGILQQRIRQHKKAYQSLKRAIQINPKNPITWLALGQNSAIKHTQKNTLAHYQNALQYLPNNAALHDRLALTFMQDNQIQQAINAWLKANHNAPNDLRYITNLGAAYLKKQQWQLARTWLEKAETIQTNNPVVIRNLATCLLMDPQSSEPDWQRAKEYLIQLVHQQKRPATQDMQLLATAYEAVGENALAITTLTLVLKQLQDDPSSDSKRIEQLEKQLIRLDNKTK